MHPILNTVRFRNLFEIFGDTAGLELSASYLEDAQRIIAKIEVAFAAKDVKAVRAAAHQLKSSAAMMGGMMLAEQCNAIEHEPGDTVECFTQHVANLLILHQATSQAVNQETEKMKG